LKTSSYTLTQIYLELLDLRRKLRLTAILHRSGKDGIGIAADRQGAVPPQFIHRLPL
jgi:hypothetical protein